VRDRNKDGFLRRELAVEDEPGPITDVDGRTLGTHRGLLGYTIGQREGLGIAAGHPLYVVALDRPNNRLVVGPREALLSALMPVERVNWLSIAEPSGPVRASVKIRSRHEGGEASIEPGPERTARVAFDSPQTAITPGQAAVFYDGDLVLGGGWISAHD
jgi:tRNA-uridine 2-sulfurtransferase